MTNLLRLFYNHIATFLTWHTQLRSHFAAWEIANQVELGFQNMLSTIIIVKKVSRSCFFLILPQLYNVLKIL